MNSLLAFFLFVSAAYVGAWILFGIIVVWGIWALIAGRYLLAALPVAVMGIFVVSALTRYAEVKPAYDWVADGDRERRALLAGPGAEFYVSTLRSIHLDWPVTYYKGRPKFRCGGELLCDHLLFHLGDPETPGFIEVGQDQIFEVTTLIGDFRCWEGGERMSAKQCLPRNGPGGDLPRVDPQGGAGGRGEPPHQQQS